MSRINKVGIPKGGQSGQVLVKSSDSDFDTEWGSGSGIGGGLTSVGLSMPSAFGVSNSPLTSDGTIYVTALGTANQFIKGDGTLGTIPVGNDTEIQFNDASSLGADSTFTFNKTLKALGLESIDFAVTPTAPTAERRLQWDNDEGSLNLTLKGGLTNIALGAEVAIMCYNAEATTLNKGEVVYLWSAQGQRPAVKRASNSAESTSSKTFGMVTESIASGANGFVMQIGIVRNIDTNAYNEGDTLYLGSTAGSITTTKPSAPSHMVFVGIVLKKNASSGRIFVKPTNGFELEELHNVAISGVANNDLLVYETSSTLWKNKSISTILGYTPEQPLTFSSPLSRSTNTISIPVATTSVNGYLSSTDWNTFNNKQATITLTTTGSSGSSTFISNTLNIPTYTLAGLGGLSNPMTTLGDMIYGGTSGVATRLTGSTSATKVFLSQTGTGTASAIPAWSSVTKTDVGLSNVENTALSTWAGSTNITTLGTISSGTWSASTIGVDRGGTGATTLTGILIGSGTSAITAVTGTASQLLRRNAGNTAYEFFTPTYLTSAITSLGGLTASTQTFATGTTGTDFGISSSTSTHTFNLPTASATNRGALSNTDWSTFNGKQSAITLTTTGSSGSATFVSNTLNIPTYTLAGLGGLTNPMTTLGDMIYGGASGTPTRLIGQTTTAKQYLSQTGTGTASAIPAWATIAFADISGTLAISAGGTGQTTQTSAFDALAPSTTLGDTIYHNGTDNVRLAGNITTTKQFLSQTGTGTISAIPSWSAVTKTDVGLGSVENTALSTWAGSTNITTLGTIATGTWSGTAISAVKGGTGQTAYSIGDLLYADTTTTLAKLADVATGNALISGGVSTAPSWGKIGLTTHISGTLGVGNGGTGTATAPTQWGVIYGASATAYASTGAGSTGSVLVATTSSAPSWAVLDMTYIPDAVFKKSARVATTGTNITLAGSAPNTLDGVTLAFNDRILVKDQTASAQNGIYYVSTLGTGANGTWTRVTDADTISEIGGAVINIDSGTSNGGKLYKTFIKTTDTLGTTAMPFYEVLTSLSGSGISTLNTLTASSQTFATGTSGTDFNISSVTSTHTFNLPTASATNRGLLSFADWTTFNNKLSLDANNNLSADNFLSGYTTTATSATTTTLAVSSSYYQYFTGTTTQTIVLPVVTTLVNGFSFRIVNLSTGNITINTSGGNAVQVMSTNTELFVYVINTGGGTGTASWNWSYSSVNNSNQSATIAGATTANALAKFNSTGGLIADSNIIDNGSLIQLNVASYHTGGVYNSSFYASQSGLDISPVTWLGTSGTTNANFALNYSSVLKTLAVNNDYVSIPILTRSITEATSGTHNLFAQVAIQALSLTNGTATTTNSATLYIEGATTGTATITNNYALWVDSGVTRLDGTAIINGADATTNSVKSAGYFQGSLTTGTPAVGIGTSFGLNTQTGASTYKLGSTISSVSTNVTAGTEAFDLFFSNMTGGATATERMRIKSTGQVQFNGYTSPTAFSGTPVASLLVNSSGNIITQEPVLQATFLTIPASGASSVQTSFTTPQILVTGQANKVIVPVAFIFKLDSTGTAFATNTNYQFQIGTQAVSISRSFAGTTDIYTLEPVTALVSTATANLVGQNLVWKVLVGNPTGGGTATISIGCVYTLMTI